MNKQIVLVTGAAGFIGSAVAKRILSMGYDVVTVDNLSTGYKTNIPENVIFYEGDLQDKHLVSQLEKYNFFTIFHIAGQSSGEISFDDPVYDLQSNAQSTLLLIQLALKVNCKKFIYASTMSVYGEQEDKPITEETTTSPKSFYSVGKLASEHYMNIYKDFGIDFFAMRLFNVYGPGQNMDNLRQGMVSIFLNQAITNNHIIVKGDNNRYRDMVFIDDIVNAFIYAFKSDKKGFQVYNVCTGQKTKVKEVIAIITNLFTSPIGVEYKGNTAGDVFGIYGSNKKIKNELDWTPKMSLVEGIKLMYEWAISRKDK